MACCPSFRMCMASLIHLVKRSGYYLIVNFQPDESIQRNHYGLVATPMPLDIKLHPVPTRVENSLCLPRPTVIMWLSPLFFFPRTVRDWNILSEVVVRASSPELSSFLLVICVVDINLDVVPLPIVNKHVHKRYGSSYTLADNKRVNT